VGSNVTTEMNSSETQRQELERAVELLGKNTRPGRLLAFIGARHFERPDEHLSEFEIAIEVFGRSAKSFDSTQDAVVRVEAHRLRKKLREIYEKGHGPHGVQIALPAGTYVIKFLPVSEPLPPVEGADHPEAPDDAVTNGAPVTAAPVAPRFARWPLYLIGVVIAAAVALSMMRDKKAAPTGVARSRPAPAAMTPDIDDGKLTEAHILAGYNGSEVIDNSGTRWKPDRFFTGGGAWPRNGIYIRGTARQFMFANSRSGQFGYDIPLKRGIYELRLFFVAAQGVGDEKISSFNVLLNGKPLLASYDPNISAFGNDVADERIFRDITPGDDGYLRLGFYNEVGTPALTALEITPGEAGKQKPIRIIAQPTSFVDHKGSRWTADDYYVNGFRSINRAKVSGTEDPELFAGERFGHFGYAIPVDPRGHYTVILHFAEFYFGPQRADGGIGSRVFHVFCNGQALLQDFDIFKEAGSLRVVTKTFPNVRPSAQGKINLTFEPVNNNATVSGIEVIDESQ
jgi:hypothetical protein